MNNISVDIAKNSFVVKAPYQFVGHCQGIPSRRFIKATKSWVAPITKMNAKYLLNTFQSASWTDAARAAADEVANRKPPDHKPFPDWYTFKTKPYDHQKKALNKAWACEASALFMEMGTGKTKTTIDLLCARAIEGQINAALILAPLSVVLSWRDEIRTHSLLSSSIHVLQGGTKTTAKHEAEVPLANGFNWYLGNIEGLSAGKLYSNITSCIAGKNLAMVVDESTRIKNPQAVRTKKAIQLAALSKYRMILSGLPTLKGPIDLYAQFQFLDPNIIGAGDFFCFKNRYVVMGGYEGREIIGYQNLDELTALVEPHTYSITKKQALDLPDKVYQTLRAKPTAEQTSIFNQIRREGRVGAKSLKNVLEKVLRLQQAAAGILPATDDSPEADLMRWADNPKVKVLRELIEDYEGQFVVWCTFKREVEFVCDMLDASGITFVHHTGDQPPLERRAAIDTFQKGNARAFVGTVQSGGIGITLTAASLAVYMSNSWSLEARAQSEDRLHRIGQRNPVEYVNLILENSVDELVLDALKDKKDLAEYVRGLIESRDSIRGFTDDNPPF